MASLSGRVDDGNLVLIVLLLDMQGQKVGDLSRGGLVRVGIEEAKV